MDMPSRCADCILRASPHKTFCVTNFMDISDDEYYKQKPTWCPLREVPQKKEIAFRDSDITRIEKIGYNDCIDEILGGAE